MIKKYANALYEHADFSENKNLLGLLVPYAQNCKLQEILSSRIVKSSKKVDVLVDILKSKNVSISTTFINFLHILAENSMLGSISMIFDELIALENFKDNKSIGFIYTSIGLSDDEVKYYEEQLSRKFNKSIKLTPKIAKSSEIRVELRDLGYEITISNEILKNKIKEFIIKAI